MPTDKPTIKKETPKAQEVFEPTESTEEQLLTPEQVEDLESKEKVQEVEEVQEEAQIEDKQLPAPAPSAVRQAPHKDKLEQEIESVLEQDLTDMYLSMSSEKQIEFKQKGEETLSKIRALANATKVNAKKIFHLIKDWLKIIPGVNRFFIEQEAKIKTDKILLLTEEEKKQGDMDTTL